MPKYSGMTYYEILRSQYSFTSIVPEIMAGRAMTNEDTAIWSRLQWRPTVAGYAAQAARIMDQGRLLTPFIPSGR